MPPKPFEPTTRDSLAEKRARVLAFLAIKKNQTVSNREAGRRLGVDEGMIRKYKLALGIPPLLPGSGRLPGETKEPQRRKRKTRRCR